MRCSWLLILGLILNVAHCLEILGLDRDPNLEVSRNITAVLGEDVYLTCRYLGKSQIQSAVWKRRSNSQSKSKRLAGFSQGKSFGRDEFSTPHSLTNLTVKMNVSSVEVEGEYVCEFESEEEDFFASVFVTVVARPQIQILVDAETINGTHYQVVSCSAVSCRPTPQISWLVGGLPPSDHFFSLNVTETHSNGTSTLSSVLSFPTHLQDENIVTCIVKHPTLLQPKLTTAVVETYTTPNVTIKAEMVQQGGNDSWVVSCVSSGGRPDTDISLALNTAEELQRENDKDSDTQKMLVYLPITEFQGHNITCVFDHPKFTQKQSRVFILPTFSPPNITINASSEWRDSHKYTKVDCSADSAAPAAAITWQVGNTDNNISYVTEDEVQADGFVLARSSVHFLSSLYAGQNLTCIVKHPSLESPETRTIHIPVHKAPLLSVSLVRQQDSPLWLAVCRCRGVCVGKNLAWVLPENAKSQMSLHSEYEGHILEARLTYQFPLALHEGQDLTCVYQFESGITEETTFHVPRYYITCVRVLNHTTPLQSRYGPQPVVHRLAVHENHQNQKILLHVEGNVPEYELRCKRSDGSLVPMEGAAMILQSELTDKVLYTCWASFCHHAAAVNIQVEVINEGEQFALVTMICISSASAILLILAVTLCMFCKINSRTDYKKRESVSALTALMQEPTSPEMKKPAVTEKDSKKYAQPVSYSIVIDVKSTV